VGDHGSVVCRTEDGAVFIGQADIRVDESLSVANAPVGALSKFVPGGSGPVVDPGPLPLIVLTLEEALERSRSRSGRWKKWA
jgi:hypothetical protein